MKKEFSAELWNHCTTGCLSEKVNKDEVFFSLPSTFKIPCSTFDIQFKSLNHDKLPESWFGLPEAIPEP